MHTRVSKKDVADLAKHRDHLVIIAGGTPKERRTVLDRADLGLVKALKTPPLSLDGRW